MPGLRRSLLLALLALATVPAVNHCAHVPIASADWDRRAR
jgi:hypothetical protein